MPDRRVPITGLPKVAAAASSTAPASPRLPSDRGQGRHPFSPTAAQSQMVTVFRATGLSPAEIAQQLGIARSTLYKHFRGELDHGRTTIVARIGAQVVKQALAGNMRAAEFYLKAHGGPAWRDTQRHEHTGADGVPLAPPNLVVTFLQPKPSVPE